MTAQEKFQLGDRVRLSARGNWRGGHQLGRVVGFGRKPWTVRVHRDSHENPATYHIDDWDVATDIPARPAALLWDPLCLVNNLAIAGALCTAFLDGVCHEAGYAVGYRERGPDERPWRPGCGRPR